MTANQSKSLNTDDRQHLQQFSVKKDTRSRLAMKWSQSTDGTISMLSNGSQQQKVDDWYSQLRS
jgi:hypothetical protein